MDNDDENEYDPRDFVYSQSSDSDSSDDETSNSKQLKNSKYGEYKESASNFTSENVNTIINTVVNQKESTMEYFNNEDDNSMDSFCHKLKQLDVDTSQYTLSFSKLLSTSTPNIPTDSVDLEDSSRFRISDANLNINSQPLSTSMPIDSNYSIDNSLQFNHNHSGCDKTLQHNNISSNSFLDTKKATNTHVYQLRHLRSPLTKQSIEPITNPPSKTLSESPSKTLFESPSIPLSSKSLSSKSLSKSISKSLSKSIILQKKSLKNKIPNKLPTRSNPKRSSTISLPSYEIRQKVKKLIVCKKTSCGKQFATESELEIHEQIVHPYECPYPGCNLRFDKFYYVKKHISTHANKFPMKCEIPECNKILHSTKSYQSHLMKHSKSKKIYSRVELEKTSRSGKINYQGSNYIREANIGNDKFVENADNERYKVSVDSKRSRVNDDNKKYRINMDNKKCRVSEDNESSEVSVDKVVIVISDMK